jgi:hypothetical protein
MNIIYIYRTKDKGLLLTGWKGRERETTTGERRGEGGGGERRVFIVCKSFI